MSTTTALTYNNPNQERLGLPVLPGALPVFGHQLKLLFAPMDFVQQARRLCQDSNTDFVWVSLGLGNWVLDCFNPNAYEVLRDKSCSVRHYANFAPTLLGNSLLTQDGEPHRSARNAMNTPFTPKGLSGLGTSALMKEVVEQHVAAMLKKSTCNGLIETRNLALDIIFRILGIDHSELDQWREHYEEVMLSLLPFPWKIPGFPAWRAARARAWVETRILSRVNAIRKEPEATGLLAEMVRGWDAREERGEDRELVDNVLLLALAGHETTASTMTWMACALARDRALWDRVVAEAQAVGEVPSAPKDLAAFPLIEGLFRECLRLYPPVMAITRLLTEPVEICGMQIPKDTQVSFPVVAWYRDERFYPDPERFTPERWLGRDRRPTPMETMAFSFGPHFCLGYHVAWTEAVQFGVALALQASAAGLRPELVSGFPTAARKGLCTPKKSMTGLRWVS